jgi:hypothetical protein
MVGAALARALEPDGCAPPATTSVADAICCPTLGPIASMPSDVADGKSYGAGAGELACGSVAILGVIGAVRGIILGDVKLDLYGICDNVGLDIGLCVIIRVIGRDSRRLGCCRASLISRVPIIIDSGDIIFILRL